MTELAKIHIKPEEASHLDEIVVQFNPHTFSIIKGVSWTNVNADPCKQASGQPTRAQNAPEIQFAGGDGRTFSLELLFDTTEETDPSKMDVRTLTNQIVKLTRIVRSLTPPRPPVCEVSWGKAPHGSDFPFTGVVSQLTQQFNLFRDNGQPVRANLTVAFKEWLPSTLDQKETDPDFTTRLVMRGDTLSSIAAEVYRDPTLWRTIAEANHLDDPRQVPIGLRLSIPKL